MWMQTAKIEWNAQIGLLAPQKNLIRKGSKSKNLQHIPNIRKLTNN